LVLGEGTNLLVDTALGAQNLLASFTTGVSEDTRPAASSRRRSLCTCRFEDGLAAALGVGEHGGRLLVGFLKDL
jgi:hypothetical protein